MPAKKNPAPETTASRPSAPARRKQPAAPRASTHKPKAKPAPAPRGGRKKTPLRPEFNPASHHDEIAREAYLLWLGRGMRHGGDHADWLDAIEIVKARHTA